MDDEAQPDQEPAKPLIKRRWAVVRKAGGGVAVLAVAGAIALGDTNDNTDYGQDGSSPDSHISAES